jgi:hypothetical protein
MHIAFWLENLQGRDHLEDLGIGEKIRMDLTEKGWECVDCLHLAQGTR